LTARGPIRVGYLAGSGHTGSTLLALLMNSHPQVISVGETAFKPSNRRRGRFMLPCSCGNTYAECPFWRDVFARVRGQGFDLGPQTWTNDYRYENRWLHRGLTQYSGRPVVRWIQRKSLRWLPVHAQRLERIDRVNLAFIQAALGASNKEVFFDTSKRSLRLERLAAIPEIDLRLIILVRDVRGFASSAKRRGRDLESEAWTWKCEHEVVREIAQLLPPDHTALVRYEDICADPAGQLTALHRFLSVQPAPPPEVIFPSEHHVLGNRIRLQKSLRVRASRSWEEILTPAEVRRVVAIAGDLNTRLGYQQ
jgi:hypothetical protein